VARAAVEPRAEAVAAAAAEPLARFASFPDVVALVRARRDMSLLVEIETGLRLVKYAPGRIEFEPSAEAAPDLASRLAQRLQEWTGVRWGVSVVSAGGGATLAEEAAARKGDLMAQALAHPMVQAALAAFPGATIRDIRTPEALAAVETAAPEDDDAWDPFDPFDEE
jgi:DNA polymerase-3 subunit gamma/tau